MLLRMGTNARFTGLQPPALLGLIVATLQAQDNGAHILWVSSVTDREHSYNSLHYAGQAFDLVLDPQPSDQRAAADRLGELLGSQFDVIAEGDHMHVEYQPNR